jgi:hypothetical protein
VLGETGTGTHTMWTRSKTGMLGVHALWQMVPLYPTGRSWMWKAAARSMWECQGGWGISGAWQGCPSAFREPGKEMAGIGMDQEGSAVSGHQQSNNRYMGGKVLSLPYIVI